MPTFGFKSATIMATTVKARAMPVSSSITSRSRGAPMRWMIDRIVGIEESVLDVAVDGLVAILGASSLTLVLHVIIEAL
jgi:hypothetical protein